MSASNANNQPPGMRTFIEDTLIQTVMASRWRLAVFCCILFLQFFAVSWIMSIIPLHYPDSYAGIKAEQDMRMGIGTVVGLIQYLLMLVLIIKSTATGGTYKWIVLYGALFAWAFIDLFASGVKLDSQQQQLRTASFTEHQVPVYGIVIYSAYWHGVKNSKGEIAPTNQLVGNKDGYYVVVLLADTTRPFTDVKSLYSRYGPLVDRSYTDFVRMDIEHNVTALTSSLLFVKAFPGPLPSTPDLPPKSYYIKMLYDSVENNIDLYTDPETSAPQISDSLPVIPGR